ncbi:MAG: HD domain-containing protein [Sedimentisphaerales bacterium]|nr:HD domain-containing protein [Sedimentisphaerales bacterium]
MKNKLLENIIREGKSKGFDEKHALNVTSIAMKLFDELQDLHHMGNTEKIWLEIASMLHDAGKFQNREIHHKLARDIIIDLSAIPFGKKEKIIIGLIARYHKSCIPDENHKYYRELDTESKEYVSKLAAILRIADGLVCRKPPIKEIFCEIKNRTVTFHINSKKNIPLDKAVKKANLFSYIFRKSPIFNLQINTDIIEKTLICI